MSNVSIDNLSEVIMKELQEYNQDVTDNMKKSIKKAMKDCDAEIRKHIKFKNRTGDYINSFRIKTMYEDKYNKRMKWYVKHPYSSLTHLLEKGHAKRNGGRTRAFPHICYGEKIATQNLLKYIKEGVN